ncbi:MAG TPA: hypothetical protein VF881_15915 [Polyangiaceae bacterium]
MIKRAAAALSISLLALPSCSPAPPRPPPTNSGGWFYEIVVGAEAKELSVIASFPAGSQEELTVDDGVDRFVRDLRVARRGTWESVASRATTWVVPSCRSQGCQIRYRFMLEEASTTLDDLDLAMAHEGAFIAPPSTWLVRPTAGPVGQPFRFRVRAPPGVSFVTGVFPSASEPDTFRADIGDLSSTSYTAFGRLGTSRLTIGGATLEVALAPGSFAVGERALFEWIEASATTVARYYGRFPVPRLALIIVPTEGSGCGYAKTLGNGGASILVPVGRRTTLHELREDWVLVHEMTHLAFPSLPRPHIWLEEGIATYIEPIARARVGRLPAEAVWEGLVRGLPKGRPAPGDRGLDVTHSWGRTYWGGALFCFLADVEIRERTQNRRSLDDALRSILAQGGDVSVRWELARVLDQGDKSTGVAVLRELHEKMGSYPYDVDLEKLWTRLGVKLIGRKIEFDDRAPLADIRRAITGSDTPKLTQ